MSESGKEKEEQKYKSIKVKEKTYEDIKDMGKGISGAVELLIEQRQKAVTDKIEGIGDVAGDIADIMFASGFFDISFAGGEVESIEEVGDNIVLRGFINVGIPDKMARAEVMEALKDGLERTNS